MDDDRQTHWRAALAAVFALALPIMWAIVGSTVAEGWGARLRAAGSAGELWFVGIGALGIALCAPASLVYITGGLVFGVGTGTWLGALAGAIGSSVAFGLSRTLFGKRVANRLRRHARLERFERALSQQRVWLPLLLRLSLLFPIGPVSYALGLSGIPARHFLITSPALLPAVFTYSYAGSVAHDVFAAQRHERQPWEWWLLGGGLLATAAVAWLVARAATQALKRHDMGQPTADAGGRRSRASAQRLRLDLPRPCDSAGRERLVGVEIEFAALDLSQAGRRIQGLFGGEIVGKDAYELRVLGTRLGDFRVEVDSHALHDLEKKRRRRGLQVYERLKAALLDAVAHSVTPHEISTAPLRPAQLSELDRLTAALRDAGAEGTDAAPWHVLGVHFNPSVPSSDPRVLCDYIRAYVLLHAQLVTALQVDLARRLMRFATAYPAAYARRVLDPHYVPKLPQLIDDYLHWNPTRNRGLDLLPLFTHLDPERVRKAIDDPRIVGRPTFHFRLPNSQISDPNWHITDEWRMWLEVERLAGDRARLAAISGQARSRFERPLGFLRPRPNALGRLERR